MKRLVCLLAAVALAALSLSAEVGTKLPREIRVAYAKSPFNLPLIVEARRGTLEKAFAAKGVALKFYEIDSGAKQAEAMAAGSLDIAGVINTTSALLAASAGNDLKIVLGLQSPDGAFRRGRQGSGDTQLRRLEGQKSRRPQGNGPPSAPRRGPRKVRPRDGRRRLPSDGHTRGSKRPSLRPDRRRASGRRQCPIGRGPPARACSRPPMAT